MAMLHDGVVLPDGRMLGVNGEEFLSGFQFASPDGHAPNQPWRINSSKWRDRDGLKTYKWNGDPASGSTTTCDPSGSLSADEIAANKAAVAAYIAARLAEIRAEFYALGKTPASWGPAWLK